MSQLESLRRKIAQLRQRRALVRAGAGLATLLLAIVLALVVAFLVDWTWSLSRSGRVVLQLTCLVGVGWIAIQYVLPWFQVKEADLDLALMLERKHNIDSDLVAAIQFESPEASRWGSAQLEHAVIDYVADFSRDWNVLEGFSASELVRRLGYLAVALAVVVPAMLLRPDFTTAFFQRMLLSRNHYPTRTQIESLALNGQQVDPRSDGTAVVKFPFGRPLEVLVAAAGELPQRGQVQFAASTGNGAGRFDIVMTTTGMFSGKLPKLVEPMHMEISLGDARTDRVSVLLVPLPVVELQIATTPPKYARYAAANEPAQSGNRLAAVLEGSQVDLGVREVNKPLAKVTMRVQDAEYPLVKLVKASAAPSANSRPGASRVLWRLPPENSPLANITQAMRYEIDVVDEDGLSPEMPLTGSIRLKTDNLPRISGEVVTRFVLPSATPQIEYRANDDYGISQLSVLVEVLRGDRGMTMPVGSYQRTLREIPPGQWIASEVLPVVDRYPLELSSLGLQKDDQVRLTLQATDYRGQSPGQVVQSEPIVLEVTDESGILAAIAEADERSAQQLDAIIERQLGVGATQ